jgi:RsiW-degrading membrane proteinase PrsW (M82 family)
VNAQLIAAARPRKAVFPLRHCGSAFARTFSRGASFALAEALLGAKRRNFSIPASMNHLERLQFGDQRLQRGGMRFHVYFGSRNPWVAGCIAGLILSVAIIVAWQRQSQAPDQAQIDDAEIRAELARSSPDFPKVLRGLAKARADSPNSLEVSEAITQSALKSNEKSVALAYWESLRAGFSEPTAELVYAAYYVVPLPRANELAGDLCAARHDVRRAVTYYHRELKLGTAEVAKKLVALLLAERDLPAVRELTADTALVTQLPADIQLVLAARKRDWRATLAPLMTLEVDLLTTVPLLVSAVAGSLWLLIIIQAAQPRSFWSFQAIGPIISMLLGLVGGVGAVFVALWQQEMWGLRTTGDFFDDLLYFVMGVAPREEALKLACVLPLLPLLLVRGHRLEMLTVSAAAGLGFALEENLHLFASMGTAAALGRFLTASFLHVAATGILGLAFCEIFSQPLRKLPAFVFTFCAVVLAHGCYDAFMVSNEGFAVVLISVLSFLLLALGFFRTVRPLRDPASDHVALPTTFIAALALLMGLSLVCVSMTVGFGNAIRATALPATALLMVAHMFYWQLGEGSSHESEAMRLASS